METPEFLLRARSLTLRDSGPAGTRALRRVWIGFFGVAVLTAIAAIPSGIRLNATLRTLHLPDPRWSIADVQEALAQLNLPVTVVTVVPYLSAVVLGFSFLAVAALIVWRKPGDRGVLTIASLLVLVGWATAGTHVIFESVYPQWQVPLRTLGVTAFGCLTLVLYVFPDGRFVPRWTRWPALVNLLVSPLNALDSPVSPLRWPVVLSTVFALASLALPLAAQVYRYRVVATMQQRQQTKWVGFSVLILSLGSVPVMLASWLVPELPAPGVRGLLFHLLSNSWLTLLMLLVPVSIAVAVLRLRLWDVDPLLNRTLVYGTLTLLVGTLYILTLGLLGAIFQAPDHLIFSLLAAGVIAVLFEPVRRGLQHSVNRLMYGDRDNPYGVVTRLAERLEGAPAPEAVLATIVQTVREAFRVPYAAVELSGSAGRALAVVHDPPTSPLRTDPGRADQDLRLPLAYQGEPVGSLTVAPRSPGEGFSGHDRRLLDDLGRHAGTALYAVRTATELQLARENLVAAGQEERRRLRRDLHDGLGPMLATLSMKLDVVQALQTEDPARAQALVAEVQAEMKDTLALVRRLVYTLYPPVLDELGLPTALREQASSQLQAHGVAVEIDLPERRQPLPAAVEVAAYYIAVEAMINIRRHARATRCQLKLRIDQGIVTVEIADDGAGIPAGTRSGAGLHSMRERAEEVGGSLDVTAASPHGSRIRAELPLNQENP